VVGRRRAGRRQWTASWALAGEPRALPGNLLAAAVRGAEHRLLAHGPAVQPWLRRSPPTRVRLVSGCGRLGACVCVPAAATVVPVSRLMGGDRVGGRWGGAYTLLLTLVKSRRLTTSANSNRLRSLRSKRLSYDCTRTSSPVPSQKRLGSCTSLSLSLFTHDNQLSGQVPSAAIAKLIRLKELQLGASPQRAVIPPLSQRSGSGICASAAATGNCGSARIRAAEWPPVCVSNRRVRRKTSGGIAGYNGDR
jgi:hypothetical protein